MAYPRPIARCPLGAIAMIVLALFALLGTAGCSAAPAALTACRTTTPTTGPTPTPTGTASRAEVLPNAKSNPVTPEPTKHATQQQPSSVVPTPTPTAPPPTSPPTHEPVPTLVPPSPTGPQTSPGDGTGNSDAAGEAPYTPMPPQGRSFETLESFWAGEAQWVMDVADVGLPVGESDTVYRGGTELWSYLHASFQSAGVLDSCGEPVPFPGCVTLWKSVDAGVSFSLTSPVCLFRCTTCPCDASRDHTGQQQYPRVFFDTSKAHMVYEWGASTCYRTSQEGIHWSAETRVPGTGQWMGESCPQAASIGDHPNIYAETEYGNCLVGAPPGVYVEGDLLYVFVGLGRNPGHMGCLMGNKEAGAAGLQPCAANPLFGAETGYGPVEARGADANPFFEFRTISSADVVRVGDRYYMVYEGVRGPSDPTVVDDQFALGLARSLGPSIDGHWERYPGNPIIMDVANNWGIGHADLVVVGPATYLYTATSQNTRGRYVLVGE